MSSGLFGSIELSATGLRAQRARLQVVAENIANAETTRTPDGGPYRRKRVLMSASPSQEVQRILRPYGAPGEFGRLLRTHATHLAGGRGALELRLPTGTEVQIAEALDAGRFKVVYDPGHPDADEEGYVLLPNVNVMAEMVDLIAASRAYEANISAVESAKAMFLQALDI